MLVVAGIAAPLTYVMYRIDRPAVAIVPAFFVCQIPLDGVRRLILRRGNASARQLAVTSQDQPGAGPSTANNPTTTGPEQASPSS
jgi:hypothetical protein